MLVRRVCVSLVVSHSFAGGLRAFRRSNGFGDHSTSNNGATVHDIRLIIMVCQICDGTAKEAVFIGPSRKHVCVNCVVEEKTDALREAAKVGFKVTSIRIVKELFVAAYVQMAGEKDPTPVMVGCKVLAVLKEMELPDGVPRNGQWYVRFFEQPSARDNRVRWEQGVIPETKEKGKALTKFLVRSRQLLSYSRSQPFFRIYAVGTVLSRQQPQRRCQGLWRPLLSSTRLYSCFDISSLSWLCWKLR
jgi:hypothetical protein